MSVYKKLIDARVQLQGRELKKSGNNKFAGYSFFELSDFLPTVQEIFKDLGMCGVVSFTKEDACLTVVDIENPVDRIVFNSPMSEANLKGCHPIQNLGAVQSYLRRYLWVTAMEIVEHDALDSSEPLKPEVKKEAPKPYVKPVQKATFKADNPMDSTAWKIALKDHEAEGWAGAVLEGAKMALELATSADDVVQIFKINRELLDQLSKEMPEDHKQLLTLFSETKAKLSGE